MMQKPKSPHPVDIHVGRRVRIRRVMREMTQTNLAQQLGLTFQQLQKYESGANRISASRLWEIAQILDVPVTWFFDGFDGQPTDIQVVPTTDVMEFAGVIQSLPADLRKSARLAVKALADMCAQ